MNKSTIDTTLTNFDDISKLCHQVAVDAGWWHDLNTGAPIERDRLQLLMLVVTEIAEAAEGERKGINDDKLPHRKMAEVELADTVIRIFDYAEAFGYNIRQALLEKLVYNVNRSDHKPANRRKNGGKKY